MTRLHGHHALITGGGTGIGAAIARALAEEGAALTLVGRRREPLEQTASQIRSSRAQSRETIERSRDHYGVEAPGSARASVSASLDMDGEGSVLVAPADITKREEIDICFEMARAANGPVTLLVNNAGSANSLPFAETTPAIWREIMAVNCDALFDCCQAALPDLLAAEAGRIVTLASTAGLKGYAYSAPYVAAKHGAIGLTRALAAEFARTNLTVNAVCPGFADTAMVADTVERLHEKTGRDADAVRADLAGFNPQGRLLDPQEVASAVVWLCLPENRSITGQAIAVAGGEVM